MVFNPAESLLGQKLTRRLKVGLCLHPSGPDSVTDLDGSSC